MAEYAVVDYFGKAFAQIPHVQCTTVFPSLVYPVGFPVPPEMLATDGPTYTVYVYTDGKMEQQEQKRLSSVVTNIPPNLINGARVLFFVANGIE